MIAKFRFKTATRTDERVRLMNEVIAGIQVIKMYTWEKPFAKFVALARRHEIDSIRGASYIRAIILSFMLFATRVSLFVTILSYVLFGEKVTAKKVFVVTAFYNLLRQAMTNFFPQAVVQISEANVSINRLNNFMLYEEKAANEDEVHNEIPKANGNNYKEHTFIQDDSNHAVVIEKGFAKWSDESVQDYIFENLNIKIKRGSVVAIIGPVGSGKSSLLQVILKELPLLKGKLEVYGDIGYASQEPWLFTGTVRQNIVFNRPYDNLRYQNVVTRCSLKRDFSLLPNADRTVVGERGVSLSGGQRARINLARAVYQDADIYLLDDPLSAVDTHVGRELFDHCIMRYLKGKTVILVTHQLQFLKDVDDIIILENGSIKAQGTFDELQKSGLDFAKMLKNELEVREEKEPRRMSRDSSVISIISMDNMGVEEVAKSNEEQRTKGSVSSYVYRMYLVAGNSWFTICCIALMFLLAQLIASIGDVFITYWVNTEEKHFNLTKSSTHDNEITEPIIVSQNITSDFWNLSTETSIYIYTAITSIIVVLAITRSISFFYACMRSSVKLHDNMFNSIINASMRFFNTNSSGRILNRFSKDMGAIDELLPTAMLDCVQIFMVLFGIIAVVGSVNPWLLIPTFIIAIIFYFFRCFYLSTSRSVKRLEGVTRSPVFAHLNASLQGLTTIRAFGAEQTLIKEFDELQDLHSVTWFLFISTSRAFGYWLDLVCVIYIALVTLSFLFLGDGKCGIMLIVINICGTGVLSGNVGLAITQSLGLTGMFQWGMRQSAEMENQMTSVERVLEYNKIEHERPLESAPKKKPPDTWPSRGQIQFDKLFLNYFPEDPPVLVNLNFTIKPLEKVGIVGRTGAGKSSLINALFQLTDVKGSILVDGVDITEIGLHDLRCKISIIPQEPVLFSGTLRKNLDPFDEYSDVKLWNAIEDVELKEAVEELSLGLNGAVLEGGTNFSVGQRQLICLARAILRNNKILILDEATANVDPQTDGLIQSTIRNKFAQCTVLTIAHRLNTVMDSDKVLVMDAGRMVEFDHPFNLLQNEDGVFYGMVQQTGKAMAESLKTIALNSYKAKDRQSLE
ncbi:probable multidrug resistance-associated protein lethal(2)03659 isoform X2 [Photinus pyralis]|uniref:probable multidrug resistance-associated protein lethal(2)03659 isoform X2 n=1 Tax=Photinus pyralis TaxID=7054 RepID=UPI0012670E50|nr:probable multidrug resistance-associated protein lethal(2)03659 isoform X2 [Photinus pyralis]XP_031342832.1 probable multidrug resistance-associated protein lethal(2)03659 isoform X2 [Photinus pyralis]